MGRADRFRRGLVAVAALCVAQAAPARTILFVGNSFTFGAGSPVRIYHPERVRDVNGSGMAGVPALFKTFADEMGLPWEVAMEASPGRSLEWHFTERKAQLRGRWDVVLLQGYSTLDREHPGDPTRHLLGAHHLVGLLRQDNPAVRIDLVSTWSRADQTYRKGGGWYGRPIARMAEDIAAASARAAEGSEAIARVVPVGLAWNRAMRTGVADPNPYDGTAYGKVDLWSWDQYHASTAGYYLEALVEFGHVTGVDPLALGPDERAAEELGLSPKTARALQQVAHDELVAHGAALERTGVRAAR